MADGVRYVVDFLDCENLTPEDLVEAIPVLLEGLDVEDHYVGMGRIPDFFGGAGGVQRVRVRAVVCCHSGQKHNSFRTSCLRVDDSHRVSHILVESPRPSTRRTPPHQVNSTTVSSGAGPVPHDHVDTRLLLHALRQTLTQFGRSSRDTKATAEYLLQTQTELRQARKNFQVLESENADAFENLETVELLKKKQHAELAKTKKELAETRRDRERFSAQAAEERARAEELKKKTATLREQLRRGRGRFGGGGDEQRDERTSRGTICGDEEENIFLRAAAGGDIEQKIEIEHVPRMGGVVAGVGPRGNVGSMDSWSSSDEQDVGDVNYSKSGTDYSDVDTQLLKASAVSLLMEAQQAEGRQRLSSVFRHWRTVCCTGAGAAHQLDADWRRAVQEVRKVCSTRTHEDTRAEQEDRTGRMILCGGGGGPGREGCVLIVAYE